MSIEQIIDDFEFLDDWEERYRYVIDLGRTLEPLPDTDRTEANRVQGCVSNVWLVWETDASAGEHVCWASDTSTMAISASPSIPIATSTRSPTSRCERGS